MQLHFMPFSRSVLTTAAPIPGAAVSLTAPAIAGNSVACIDEWAMPRPSTKEPVALL